MRTQLATALITLFFALVSGISCCPLVPPPSPLDFVVPVDGTAPDGRTYAELAAAWWQWSYSIPAHRPPLLDDTGEHAAEGQTGAVWFLAGTRGNALDMPVTRTVEIPAGKALFFPILNIVFDCDAPLGPQCDEELAAGLPLVVEIVDTTFHLSATINGAAVASLFDFRVQSAIFEVTFVEDNIQGHAPVLDNAVTDGYWLLLDPMPPGEYVLHFEGALGEDPENAVTVSVTYNLTVAP